MIEINLLPEELRKKESVKLSLPAMPALPKKTVLLAVGVVLGVQVLFTAFAFFQKGEAAAVRKDITALNESNRGLVAQKTESAEIRKRLSQIDHLLQRKFFWSSLLNALTDSMIKGVWLTNLSIAESNASPMIKKTVEVTLSKADTLSPRKTVSSTSRTPPKSSKMLKLEGSVVGPGEETALIGKFIKKMKGNALFDKLFAEIEPANINQKKIREFDVYDFTIGCVFKEGVTETAS